MGRAALFQRPYYESLTNKYRRAITDRIAGYAGRTLGWDNFLFVSFQIIWRRFFHDIWRIGAARTPDFGQYRDASYVEATQATLRWDAISN